MGSFRFFLLCFIFLSWNLASAKNIVQQKTVVQTNQIPETEKVFRDTFAERNMVQRRLEGSLNAIASKPEENEEVRKESEFRTATGGIIYQGLVSLTMFAVIGNVAFLIYVFWLSK
jgi:hypothetical protein